ncbi:hypothetical protein SESBI_30222 [Sesbania bispinosa]|nr:hypothetical protein SESBI_30222 [Sesbania bispinosa]
MREGSCFPRPRYRKKVDSSQRTSNSNSVSRAPSPTSSMIINIDELKSLELLDGLFKESCRVGEKMISEGLITGKDIEEAKSGRGSRVISIGNDTELTPTNRPREKFFDWFLNPLLIIKEQIKAENLSASEEDYLCKLVLLTGDVERLKRSSIGLAPKSEVKHAELDALARRLQGITESMTRFPNFGHRFNDLVKALSDDHAQIHGVPIMTRSRSAFAQFKFFQGDT